MSEKQSVSDYLVAQAAVSRFHVNAQDIVIQKPPENLERWSEQVVGGWAFDFRNGMASFYTVSGYRFHGKLDGRVEKLLEEQVKIMRFSDLPPEAEPLRAEAEKQWMNAKSLTADIL